MKALNVDDKDENLYFIETLLRAEGFDVINAHNGVEALELLKEGPVDLIVSDVLMPQMDGFQLCHEVRSLPALASVPFVFYTGTYRDAKDAALAQKLGATRYLLKPMEPLELMRHLREVMGEARVSAPAVQPLPHEDETIYLKNYNERLVQKLEEKVQEYEALSNRLQNAFDEKVREVVERIHVEDSLRLNEERYRAVVSSLAEGILLADNRGRLVACNESAASILGLPQARLVGASLTQLPLKLLHEDGREVVPEKHPLLHCLKTGQPVPRSVFGIAREGRPSLWLSVAARPCIRNAGGATQLAVMSFTDITVERLSQEQIRSQAHIIDHSHDAIIICSPDGTVQYWNQGAQRLYGWTSEEALGRQDWELYGRAEIPTSSPLCKALTQKTLEGEFRHLTKDDRELVVQGRLTAIESAAGEPQAILAFYFDITEKKDLEEKFLRAQRLESIGILAGGVAHDLNNILAPILLAVPIIRMRVTDRQGLMMLDTMEASATRGAQIVRQILTFSRGLRTERVSLNTRHLLKEVAEITQEAFPRDIIIDTDFPRNLWSVEADATQLHQVLMNLCVNARDAMPGGGTLLIKGENVELTADQALALPGARPGRFTVLSITDTGSGIPKANLARVFEPFFSTKDPGKGTGLGLSTARSIVEQHQGFITLESTLGEGTCFKVFLPALASEEETTPLLTGTLPKGSGQTILVVDDEFALRHICENLLTAHDYRVLSAENGQRGLALMREHQFDVSLVITDLVMPVMSGAELIPMLRGMKPSIKIIAISGLASTSPEGKVPAGVIADAFLNKPFSAEHLLKTVHDVLAETR